MVVAAGTPSEESSTELGSTQEAAHFLPSIHPVTIPSTLPSAGLGALLALGSLGSQRGSPNVRQKSNPARRQRPPATIRLQTSPRSRGARATAIRGRRAIVCCDRFAIWSLPACRHIWDRLRFLRERVEIDAPQPPAHRERLESGDRQTSRLTAASGLRIRRLGARLR